MILITLQGLQTLQTLQVRGTTLFFSVYICPHEIVHPLNEFLAFIPVVPALWRHGGVQCQNTGNSFSFYRPSAAQTPNRTLYAILYMLLLFCISISTSCTLFQFPQTGF